MPVSDYLSRDVGTWAASGSVVHTIFALQVHGSGRIRDFLAFFVAPDGSPLLNSFGLGNWTGLAIMTGKPWFTAGFATLLALGVLMPSTVCAQDGAAGQESGSVQQQRPGTQEGPAYDATREATFKGTVADVQGGRSALYWFSRIHTFGLGHMPAADKQLLLKTDTETLEVQLGPSAFLTDQKVEISDGDTLEVIGSRVTIGESQVVLAREMRKGDETWRLRDAAGQPLWSSGATEARGFWTTKKVLVTVVVIKVVALATVLRH